MTRSATTAPTSELRPPKPAMMPIAAGPSPSSSTANRIQIAPNTPHRVAMAIDASVNARMIGSPRDDRQALADLLETGSRSALGGGGGSGRRIVPSSTRPRR